MRQIAVFAASIILFLVGESTVSAGFPPIILVPGNGGSQLEAKLDKNATVHYICDKQTKDYFSIWLNLELLGPVVIDCWVDNMKLNYNNVTRKTSNAPGVDIRIPGVFGDPTNVEWLDTNTWNPAGGYFKDIGNALVSIGYERNVSLRGAPFDFRRGPSELGEFFVNTKALVEETYAINGNESVLFIVHSMGGPMILRFLQLQSQAWKDKYVRGMLSLSGAFGGSVKSLKVFAMGDNLGVIVLPTSALKELQVTMPSIAWLMPSRTVWDDEAIVVTNEKNYTLTNIKEFFEDIDYITGWDMYQNELPYSDPLKAPGVEVHCLFGAGVQTVSQLVYKPGKFPGNPDFAYADGDGTVNTKSLDSCRSWMKTQKQKVYVQPLLKVDHMGILSAKSSISYVLAVVKNYAKKIK